MKITILETFLTVVEEKSLSRAADLLYLTQPAVSKHIKTLEKLFNVSLFHRQGQKVTLTEAGEIFYFKAREIVKDWEKTIQEMTELNDNVGGVLKVGASNIPGEFVLPCLLGYFKKEYPQVKVSLEISDTVGVVRRILAEEIHLGVVGAWVERKKLQARKFMEDRLVLILPVGHPLANKGQVFPADLVGEKLVWREKGSGTRRVVEEKLQKAGVSPEGLTTFLELGSNQSIITAVEEGFGISLVSSWSIRGREKKRLVCREMEGVSLSRDLYFLYPREQFLPRSALELLRFSEKFDPGGYLQDNKNG